MKDAAGRVYQEGKIGSTRRELDEWIRTMPQPRTIAMEATIFTGWIYDHLLPHAEKVKVAHPLMLRAIAAAKKKNDRIDAGKIADCLRCDFLPECHMATTEIRDRRRTLRYRSALFSNQRLILRETQRAVTPLGGVAVFVVFLHRLGFVEKLRQHMPIQLKSPNHIDPTATFTAFLIAVLAGARRFAHANWLRGDRALHALLGLSRFPIDDTIRNFFRRFGLGDVHRLFDPLAEWQMERLPQRSGGYSLDLDSTVFERYGNQQGSLKGHNPRKHGRPSHHPLLAVLAEAHFLLHGWLRSGNCGAARGVVEFLQEALALWGQRQMIRLVRADAGFFEDKLLSFLEQRSLPYIVVARLTKWIKREAQRVPTWKTLDGSFSVGEFRVQLLGWERARRFVGVRELVREGRNGVGFHTPSYADLIYTFAKRTDVRDHINEPRLRELRTCDSPLFFLPCFIEL